ncbi:MAG: ATP-binding protein [Acidobacteriota bacterium]
MSRGRVSTVSRQLLRRVALLGLLCLAGFCLALLLSLQLVRERLSAELRATSTEVADSIDALLGGVQRDLGATSGFVAAGLEASMARGTPIEAGHPDLLSIRTWFRESLEREDAIYRLALLGADGNLLLHRQRVALVTMDEGLDPWLQSLSVSDHEHLGQVDFIGVGGEGGTKIPFVTLSKPVRGTQGELLANLVARIDLSSLWSHISSLEVGREGSILLLDEEGHLLVYRDLEMIQGRVESAPASGAQAAVGLSDEIKLQRNHYGRWVVSLTESLDRIAPWVVVVQLPAREILVPFALQALPLLLLLSLVGPVVYGIVLFTRQRIVAPLQSLLYGVRRFGEGQLDFRIRLDHQDELGDLAGTFNLMARELRSTIADLELRYEELKRAEQALRETKEQLEQRVQERTADLEATNEEMKALLYLVSHDLRAPLINLKGFANELRFSLQDLSPALRASVENQPAERREPLQRSLDEDIPEALEFIETSVSRMDGFTRALLKLSRAGHRELLLETVEVSTVVDQILQSLAFQVEQRQITVEVGPLPMVVADRLSIEQIFGNLLTNAFTYATPSEPRVKIGGEERSGETLYWVEDNGIGISQDDLEKIFQPFRRIDHSLHEGEGMGLTYAQALVRRHRGRIWCESAKGEGCRFLFTVSHELQSRVSPEDPASGAEARQVAS